MINDIHSNDFRIYHIICMLNRVEGDINISPSLRVLFSSFNRVEVDISWSL
jgi:hypothetical protein